VEDYEFERYRRKIDEFFKTACDNCNGFGTVMSESGHGDKPHIIDCPVCHGTGKKKS
jgi:hypothetical protein